MIAFLNGTLAGKTPVSAYIDVGGVGFEVGMSSSALSKLPEQGTTVFVYTYMQTAENLMALYGFLSLEERALFEQLIGVSGVGPKVALAALSTFSPSALVDAISTQDVALLQRIPGVGKKGASRIILELKGSLEAHEDRFGNQDAQASVTKSRLGATEALLSMGFTSAEVNLALKDAPETADESSLLQYALKRLGSAG